MAKRKILVTGANGFVGSCLLDTLSKADWKIIPLVQSPCGLKNEVAIDFCDENFLATINSLPKTDTIVHLGAKVGSDNDSRISFIGPNVVATAILANWAKKTGAHFVFTSTIAVFGAKALHISKLNIPDPDTDYGYSKWLAEEAIKMSGIRYAVLRIAGVFGKDGPAHLGINKAINNALRGIAPVQYGKGEIKRNYIYVKDLAETIKFCADKKLEGTHLVAGSSVNTVSEMLRIICRVILPGREVEYREGEEGRDQIIECSKELPPGRPFEEAIKEIKKEAALPVYKETRK